MWDESEQHWSGLEHETHLSEGHSDGLWDMWDRFAPREVFQEDPISLQNHIWLAVNHQRTLRW